MNDLYMFNSEFVEIWPRCLIDANGSLEGREFRNSEWMLRDKKSGQFPYSLDIPGGLRRVGELDCDDLTAARMREIAQVFLESLNHDVDLAIWSGSSSVANTHSLQQLADYGLDAGDYALVSGLPLTSEPSVLWFAGFDRYQRSLWMQRDAGRAWLAMQAAALADGVVLEAISGFRSHFYQFGIFDRKLARGITIPEILNVNAAPGFSEHHSGLALDIGTPEEPPAEESFELTPAFTWLCSHARRFGFVMSYPRDNPHGITYEPWHWAFAGSCA